MDFSTRPFTLIFNSYIRFVPSLEYEEADWNMDSFNNTNNELNLEPVIMDSDDVFALHSLMNSSMLHTP